MNENCLKNATKRAKKEKSPKIAIFSFLDFRGVFLDFPPNNTKGVLILEGSNFWISVFFAEIRQGALYLGGFVLDLPPAF